MYYLISMITPTEQFKGVNPLEMLDISRLKKANGEYTFIHEENR